MRKNAKEWKEKEISSCAKKRAMKYCTKSLVDMLLCGGSKWNSSKINNKVWKWKRSFFMLFQRWERIVCHEKVREKLEMSIFQALFIVDFCWYKFDFEFNYKLFQYSFLLVANCDRDSIWDLREEISRKAAYLMLISWRKILNKYR